jgi:hypothetical protein
MNTIKALLSRIKQFVKERFLHKHSYNTMSTNRHPIRNNGVFDGYVSITTLYCNDCGHCEAIATDREHQQKGV